MKIEELEKELEEGDKIYKGVCHDCGNSVEVSVIVTEEGKIDISGGALFKIKQGVEYLFFFKCDECFAEDPTLRNFRETEVFSRVVGYLRPVKQWNKGKKAEYEMRKEFKNATS